MDGETLRDEATDRVASGSPSYVQQALVLLSGSTDTTREWTGEDVRAGLIEALGKPHHPNVFGAVILAAVRKGLLVKTGRFVNMRDPRSHARMTPTYTFNRRMES